MEIYEEAYYRGRESWPDFRMEQRTIIRLATLSARSRVLEVGCGSGDLLSALRGVAGVVAGVDLSAAGLGMARGRGLVACARAETLPFRRGAFDTVVGQHLIEHLPDMMGALVEWRRVLRPGGRVVLVTPNADYPDPAHFEDPTHVHLFTPASLRRELETAGFRVEELFTLFPYLGPGRLARAASIRVAPLASRLPGLARSGRSIVAAATAIPRGSPRTIPAL